MHALVVEDDLILADGIALLLGDHGMVVDIVNDAIAAVRVIPSCELSAVVLDIGQAGIDGFEIVRRIRIQYRAVPVLLLTTRLGHVKRRSQQSNMKITGGRLVVRNGLGQ